MPSGRGDFDGQGHAISGLKINVDESDNPRQFEYAGLFGRIVTAGTVKNLRLVNVDIKGNDNVGALGGYISGERTVENCYVTGSVAGQNYVGGLVGNLVRAGEAHSLVVKNSYSTCKVTGSDNVGGLVGYKEKSKISNCYATGDVKGALGKDYETWAKKQGLEVKRLGGLNARETAIKIAEEIKDLTQNNNALSKNNGLYNESNALSNKSKDEALKEVFIVTESSYADALSVASIAIEKKAPILLVNSQRENAEVVKALKSLDLTTIYVVSGEGVIPVKVYKTLAANGQAIERIAGETRYSTNKAVFKKFGTKATTYSFAYGENYPDALTGSVNTWTQKGFLFLVPKALTEEESALYSTLKGEQLTIYGGSDGTNIANNRVISVSN